MSKRIGWGEFYRPEQVNCYLNQAVRWHARYYYVKAIKDPFPIPVWKFCDEDFLPDFFYFVLSLIEKFSGKGFQSIPIIKNFETIKLEEILKEKNLFLIESFDLRNQSVKTEWSSFINKYSEPLKIWGSNCKLIEQNWFYDFIIIIFWIIIFERFENLWFDWMEHINKKIILKPPKGLPKNKHLEAEKATSILRSQNDFSFNDFHWSPLVEKKQEFKKRIIESFYYHLDREIEEFERLCYKSGFRKTPEKRNLEHFKWLAFYYVENMDFEEISQRFLNEDPEGNRDIGIDSVRKAIKATARLVGLPLRK